MRPLAHGWRLENPAQTSADVVREYIRAPARAVPRAMAARLGACRVILLAAGDFASRWRVTEGETVIEIAPAEPHDLGMEFLLCLGQGLWERTRSRERDRWLDLLDAEIHAGVAGEIDEASLDRKRHLLSFRTPEAASEYARASFAATTAEYVHSLWHDVSVREGPDHLPPGHLARRLGLFARWFPPDRGYRLFAREGTTRR